MPGTTSTTAENGGKVTSLPQETTVAEELLTTATEDPETVYTTTVQAGDASEDESDNGDGTGSDDDGWQGDMPEYQG